VINFGFSMVNKRIIWNWIRTK